VYSSPYSTFVQSLLLIQILSTVCCLFNFCPQSVAYSTFLHEKPILIQTKQELKYLGAVYATMGPHFAHKNLLIGSFTFSKINTLGLPKLSKISFAFNIFVPIPVEETGYPKITPMGVSLYRTIDQTTYLKI